ncbi:MAG: LPXTG cell wall anchor domain-containing protein [Oscillospiraceae bacterium]|nr:LPXTG cell wall anchor domain-containing protein [Oscillospiraceae bacterium]
MFVLVLVTASMVLLALAAEDRSWQSPALGGEECTFTLEISKIDDGTRLPVAGAEFLMYQSNKTYLKLGANGNCGEWTENEGKATVLVTDQDGLIRIGGMTTGIYYLTETKAPQGYNRLENPIKLYIDGEYESEENGDLVFSQLFVKIDDGDPIYSTSAQKDCLQIQIENTYETILPATGGAGPAAYYIVGAIVLFAVALVIVSKRLIREET